MSIQGTGVSEISKQRQGLILDSGLELDSLPFGSFILSFGKSMQLARDPTLDCVIHQHVGEPTHHTLSMAGMYAGILFTTIGNYGYKPTCGMLLCRRGKKGSECPRVVYLVLKRSFTVSLSLLDVLFGSGWCFGLFVWVLFLFLI